MVVVEEEQSREVFDQCHFFGEPPSLSFAACPSCGSVMGAICKLDVDQLWMDCICKLVSLDRKEVLINMCVDKVSKEVSHVTARAVKMFCSILN